MRAATVAEHAAAQWVLDGLISGKLRDDQFDMRVTCSLNRTHDGTVTACIGGWMYLYMRGAAEKATPFDILEAQAYVHANDPFRGHADNPVTPLYYPPTGTYGKTREHAIVALRSFLATEIPIWPETAA